ncbi:MAG: OmpA family protein [Ferruginibacter sp.]
MSFVVSSAIASSIEPVTTGDKVQPKVLQHVSPASPLIAGNQYLDSIPKTNNDTIVVPFQYKQSSLFYPITYKLMDSIAEILVNNELVTLSINGYSYFDEGNDNICYYLSLNRALAVKSYVLGRGVDSSRILDFKALSKLRSIQRKAKKEPVDFNCTAEMILNYPIPPPPVVIMDTDADGIADNEDGCPQEFGDKAHNGCPDSNAIIVPFEPQQSSLLSGTYSVLDSVINLLRNNANLTIAIEGYAYEQEGVTTVCDMLAKDRADIVKRYLLTRRISAKRIDSVKSFGSLKPITAGRNPWEKARNSRAEIFITHH